eukprot:gnl/MRDRNA2_/MRDRNA2_113529_c0_seq1.p1 gnl/MRDRNA2_/MRDRNA2_113529_c0~~gnl/MRDRNA2_/MRDRNA2_113529_c0_seq1.p1  ORF type:complete len:776 (+),score=101.31 gnl/MRDRNA2_/MRDRNA2_113529_c0_seq1:171-2498(+)
MKARDAGWCLVFTVALLFTEAPLADMSESSSHLACSLASMESSSVGVGMPDSREHMLLLVGSRHQRGVFSGVEGWPDEEELEEIDTGVLLQRQGPTDGSKGKGKGKEKVKAKLNSALAPVPLGTPGLGVFKGKGKGKTDSGPKPPEIPIPKEPLVQAPTEAPLTSSDAAESSMTASTPSVTTQSMNTGVAATTPSPKAGTRAPILKRAANNNATSGQSGNDDGKKDLSEPRAEKLRKLAEGVLSLHSRFDWDYMHDGDQIDDSKAAAATVLAVEAKHLLDGKEPTPKEWLDLEDAEVEDSQMIPMISAESSAANGHILTAHDISEITHTKSMEDVGPNHALPAFQGDMIPADVEQLELFQTLAKTAQAQNATRYTAVAGKVWPRGVVNYCYASDTPPRVRHMFKAAVTQYQRAIPCLNFVNVGWRSGTSMDDMSQQSCNKYPAIFVQSHPQRGCYSYVGMIPQLYSAQLQLQNPGCLSVGTAVHEIGHALGMAHEQSRPDREQYVRIDLSNVKKGRERNFQITPTAGIDLSYDYLSVMHYDAYAFAVDRSRPTIFATRTVKGHDVTSSIGQRMGLSKYDVDQIVIAYKDELPQGCHGSAFAGMGCINRPGKDGRDTCSAHKRCHPSVMSSCCACGGGYKIQCYEGHPCPIPKPLPPESDHDCLINKANLFPNSGYSCVIYNRCYYPIEWKCPSLSCTHQIPTGVYRVQTCNKQVQTEICSSLKMCTVKGLHGNAAIQYYNTTENGFRGNAADGMQQTQVDDIVTSSAPKSNNLSE